MDQFSLKGRVAVITGGGGYIGRAIALGFAEAGADVAIADLSREKAEETAEAVRLSGRRAMAAEVNFVQRPQVDDFFRRVCEELGGINVLVNAIGTLTRGPAEEFDDQRFLEILDINVRGYFLACRAAYKPMMEAGGGSIINLSSIAGEVALPYAAAYCASKGGVRQLTRVLAVEWAPHIRVSAIGPCWVETGVVREIMRREPEYLEARLANLPMRRLADVKDIVGPALFLASEASAMVTGHVLMVDGGWTAQ